MQLFFMCRLLIKLDIRCMVNIISRFLSLRDFLWPSNATILAPAALQIKDKKWDIITWITEHNQHGKGSGTAKSLIDKSRRHQSFDPRCILPRASRGSARHVFLVTWITEHNQHGKGIKLYYAMSFLKPCSHNLYYIQLKYNSGYIIYTIRFFWIRFRFTSAKIQIN